MSSLILYQQLNHELESLPQDAIVINGGYWQHYQKQPGQFVFGALSLLSGIATGLLSIPSLMALRSIDHDNSDVAIFAQHPGLLIMGMCSAIAQTQFLLSDLVEMHGQVYRKDYAILKLLKDTQTDFLASLSLNDMREEDFNDERFIVAFERQLHKMASEKILELTALKKSNPKMVLSDLGEWFEIYQLQAWRDQLSAVLPNVLSFEDTLYQKLDACINHVWQHYYHPIKKAMEMHLKQAYTEGDLDRRLNQAVASLVTQSIDQYNEEQDQVFRSEIVKLYEPLLHDPDGKYIEDQSTIKQTKQVGRVLSYLNVLVNVLIGLGAFFALGQFIFWVGGVHLAIFTASGVMGWAIKLSFAGLCAIGSYLYTRHDIQSIFAQLGYRITVWRKSPKKWKQLWEEIKKPQNIFTCIATIPAAIGIGIINALGFYLAFQASPIVFALACIVFLSTMVAISAMMGKRLYYTYPRWCFYISELYKKRSVILFNGFIVVAVLASLILSSAHIPILLAFWSVTPFSTMILMVCLALVLFSVLMSLSQEWRWEASFKGSIGSICVFASIVAVFLALLPIVGPPLALFVAASSSILFFSFYVSSVMLVETQERKSLVDHFFNHKNRMHSDELTNQPNDQDASKDYKLASRVPPTTKSISFDDDGSFSGTGSMGLGE